MNTDYYDLTVSAVKSETEQAVTLTFSLPDALKSKFKPIAGQYIKLKTDIDGKDVERFYSLCDFGDDFVQVGVKRVEGGKFSNFACEHIQAGDVLAVQAPQGDFHLPSDAEMAKGQHYFFVAAGSGITPSMAMIRTLLDTQPHLNITLLYVNSRRRDIMFFDELEGLKNTHLGKFNLIHVLTQEPREIEMLSQRPDETTAGQLIDGLVGTDIDHTFMCGPLPLLELFRNTLIKREVDPKSIHMELFGTPDVAPARKVKVSTDKLQTIQVKSQGVTRTVNITPEQSVLEAALEAGVAVPFACKGGVCATCKAKRLDGEAELVLNYGLEDDDIEKGMMLTCQTYVTSETASFDFDVQ